MTASKILQTPWAGDRGFQFLGIDFTSCEMFRGARNAYLKITSISIVFCCLGEFYL
jgi:hypothetical protein